MEKYKQYVELQWWNEIEKRDVDNWIRNFGTKKELAEIILDNVIFYSATQLKAYTKFLLNDMKKQLYKKVMRENQYYFIQDNEFFSQWNSYLAETTFMPAALQSDPTSSAHKILGYWRSTLEREETIFSNIFDMEKNYQRGIRRFVLVDDFAGSGEQMAKVLKQTISFNGIEVEVGELPDIVEDIEIIVAVYVIHKKAKEKIEMSYPRIKMIYVDLISDDLNYLNKDAIMYEKYDNEKKAEIVQAIQQINDKLIDENKELQKLSCYTLSIPVVFEHGCPNNTLLLLFAQADNWHRLFKRGVEI